MIIAPLKFAICTDSNKIPNKEKIDIVASTNWCAFTVNFSIQNQGVIYEAIFKVLSEYECGIFLARCYFNICFY